MFPDPCLFSVQGEAGSPGQDGMPGLAGLPGARVSLRFLAFLEYSEKRLYCILYVSNGTITEILNSLLNEYFSK